MSAKPISLTVRAYLASRRGLQHLFSAADALLAGFWLGLLDRETLHQVDEQYYSQSTLYVDDSYNRRGLFAWERAAIETHFQDCRRLLLIGAGGGREALALARLGYQVDGVECHPGLAAYANRLLAAEGLAAHIHPTPRDAVPAHGGPYDGVIVGWGAYMLIQGRRRRIAFLRALRAQALPSAPLLLSFFARQGTERRYRLVAAMANFLRRLRRRDLAQVGDALEPNYVHYFTEPELTAELAEAGFDLCYYATRSYGHAVARARPS